MQAEHFENGLNDIKFNFIISEFGIFEGRGWDSQSDPDFNTFNNAILGEADLFDDLFSVFHRLLTDGIVLGKLNVPLDF